MSAYTKYYKSILKEFFNLEIKTFLRLNLNFKYKVFNFKKVLLEAGFFETLKDQFKALDKSLEANEETLNKIAVTLEPIMQFSCSSRFRILKTLPTHSVL